MSRTLIYPELYSVPHSNTPPARTLDNLQDTAGTSTEVSQGIPEGAQQLQS